MNVFNFSRRKVGGIWFVRLGRLQLSFCVCKKPAHSPADRTYPDGSVMLPPLEVRKYPGGSTVVVYRDR